MTATPKTALITGITGQDGSYLAEFLYGDLTDSSNLGAQSSGGVRGEAPLQQCHTPRWSGASPRMALLRRLFESGQNPMHSQRGRSSNRGHHCKAVNYREACGIYACNGILFNHYSVRQFIEKTASALGMQIRWEGSGVDEVGFAVVAGAKDVIAGTDPQSMDPGSSTFQIAPKRKNSRAPSPSRLSASPGG